MSDSCLYPLTIAGVGICFKTTFPLRIDRSFRPFLTNASMHDYLVEYRENPNLHQPDGAPLFRCESYEIYRDGAGGFIRWYFDGMDDFIYFIRVKVDKKDRFVLAEYLPRKRNLVSTLGNCFSFSGWESQLLQEHRLIFHACCVASTLGGILFSGPSGIGKSTQGALWCQYEGARLINGDRPILYEKDGIWTAFGSPYAGSSECYVNDSAPITAIIMLKQAEHCSICRLNTSEAFRRVFSQLTVGCWDAEDVGLACNLAERLVMSVPVYELACTPDRAVEMAGHRHRGRCGHQYFQQGYLL